MTKERDNLRDKMTLISIMYFQQYRQDSHDFVKGESVDCPNLEKYVNEFIEELFASLPDQEVWVECDQKEYSICKVVRWGASGVCFDGFDKNTPRVRKTTIKELIQDETIYYKPIKQRNHGKKER